MSPIDTGEAAGFDEAMNDTLRSVCSRDYFRADEAFSALGLVNMREQCPVLQERFQQVRNERTAMQIARHGDSSNPVYEQIMAVLQGNGIEPK